MATSNQRKDQIKEHLAQSTDVNLFEQPTKNSQDVRQREQRIKDHLRTAGQEDLKTRTPEVNFFRQSSKGPEASTDQRKQRIKDHIRRTLG